MRKPTVWVLYRWDLLAHGVGELKVQSKATWQITKQMADNNPQRYRTTWLAESTDRRLLEKMCELAKESNDE